jgi:hypothetical protein
MVALQKKYARNLRAGTGVFSARRLALGVTFSPTSGNPDWIIIGCGSSSPDTYA